jgi:two-component system, cell cycle response regulator
MGVSFAVSLIGFSAFERSTLEAFFRLAARRSPSYVHVADAASAQVVLVDADKPEALTDAQAVPQRSLYIGARGRDGQLAHLPRPINMMALLRLLDACVAQLPPAAAAPTAAAAAAPSPAPAPAPATPTRPAPLVAAAAPAAPKVVDLPAPRAAKTVPARLADDGPKSVSMGSRFDNILVVDDSDVALRFMANCLGRFGFEVHLARSGEEALNRVAQEHFEFVFMDVTMPGLDGYQTCKLIKKRPYTDGRRAPTVVMLTSRGGLVDKMRGTLSGCDAYLTKPLQQEALLKVIGDRIVSDVREADTTAQFADHAH